MEANIIPNNLVQLFCLNDFHLVTIKNIFSLSLNYVSNTCKQEPGPKANTLTLTRCLRIPNITDVTATTMTVTRASYR